MQTGSQVGIWQPKIFFLAFYRHSRILNLCENTRNIMNKIPLCFSFRKNYLKKKDLQEKIIHAVISSCLNYSYLSLLFSDLSCCIQFTLHLATGITFLKCKAVNCLSENLLVAFYRLPNQISASKHDT